MQQQQTTASHTAHSTRKHANTTTGQVPGARAGFFFFFFARWYSHVNEKPAAFKKKFKVPSIDEVNSDLLQLTDELLGAS
jgi:hypothetical protein